MKSLEKCKLPREEGLCFESLIRYYFDRTKSMCAPFEYSGCSGNDNNFKSLAECEASCNALIDMAKPKDECNEIQSLTLKTFLI